MAFGNGFFRDIGIDRCRADTDEHREVMHIEAFAGGDIDRGKGAELLAHQMRMHGAGRKDHRNRAARVGYRAVRQHHMLAARADGLFGLVGDAVQRSGKIIRPVDIESTVDGDRLVAEVGDKRVPFRHGQHRRFQKQVITLFRRLVENIAQIAEPRAQRHHMTFAKAVDRRVRHLREILAEEMMQAAIAVGQHRKRRVVTHRADGLLAACRHRLQDQLEVFHGPARHHLAAAHVERWQALGRLGAVLGKKRVHLLRPADPFCPVTLAGQLGLQLVIREHRATLEVDSHHLAGADAAAFDDALFRHHDHAGLGPSDYKAVIRHDIAHRAQAVPVETGNHPVVGIGGNGRRTVPRLHHGIAIGIELCQLAVPVDIDGGRNHHRLHHRQGAPAMAHQLEHRVESGRIRAALADHRLQILNGVAENLGIHPVLVAGHPVLVAANGVDLAIMRQHPERLRQLPGRHGVGRITLVIDGKGRHKALVQQVREKGRDLLGKEHALVDDRTAGHRADVEIADELGGHRLFDAAAHDIELSLGLFLVDVRRHREHDLLDLGAGRHCLVAERLRVHRHLPPAIDHMADRQDFLLDNATAAFLRRKVGAWQENHADSQPAAVIVVTGAGDMLDKEVTRDLDMDAGAVAGHAVGIDRAAVPDRLKRLDRRIDDRAGRLAVARRHKADAAGIMLHLRAIDPGIGQARLVAGAAGQISGFVKNLLLAHGHYPRNRRNGFRRRLPPRAALRSAP